MKKVRKKSKGKNKQRVLDIDIVDFKGLIAIKKLHLPHPRMHLRKFVLVPLNEINKIGHPEKKKLCFSSKSKIRGLSIY